MTFKVVRRCFGILEDYDYSKGWCSDLQANDAFLDPEHGP